MLITVLGRKVIPAHRKSWPNAGKSVNYGGPKMKKACAIFATHYYGRLSQEKKPEQANVEEKSEEWGS
jgi:hypothetical protein